MEEPVRPGSLTRGGRWGRGGPCHRAPGHLGLSLEHGATRHAAGLFRVREPECYKMEACQPATAWAAFISPSDFSRPAGCVVALRCGDRGCGMSSPVCT